MQAGQFGPSNRTLAEESSESLFVEGGQVVQAGTQRRGVGLKRRFRRWFRPEIERTDVQTVVASEDVVSHTGRQIHWHIAARASELYRQIRNAACCIDDIRFHNGIGRARLDAQRARPAQIRRGNIRWQLEGGQDLPEHQPRAVV